MARSARAPTRLPDVLPTDRATVHASRTSVWTWVGCAGAYFGLAAAVTWPLLPHAASHLPKDLGDPLLTTWLLVWHATVPPFTADWWNGAAFFPVADTLALSDHRFGVSLLSTPLLWLGATPALAYNLTLLAGIALSALGAHALAYRLTRRHDAAVVAGLAFGAAPYRLDHLEHLELVCTWWLPVAFLALHNWRRAGAGREGYVWALVAAVVWLLQGLTGGYYFVFGLVLLVLWGLWFVPVSDWRPTAIPLAAAFGIALLPLLPILARYHAVHERLGLSRTRHEIEHFSADLSGLLSGSAWLEVVPALAALRRPEGQLYPGLFIVALVAVALWRRRTGAAPRRSRVRRIATPALLIASGVALLAAITSPWRLSLGGGLTLSASHPHKPITLAMLLLAAGALTSDRLRDAWRRRSPLAFYTLATLACWALALGPTPRALGERFWYKAPYEWLMRLPGFADGFRVPARFGMLAAFALSVAAALAYARLVSVQRSWARALVIPAAALLLLDVWPRPPVLVAVPPIGDATALRDSGAAAVLELPLGRIDEDTLATYRTLAHGRPVVNGYSGHEPPHYPLVRDALAERDGSAFDPFRRRGSLLVGHADDEVGRAWMPLTESVGGRVAAASLGRRYLLVPSRGPLTPACGGRSGAVPLPHDWRGPWRSGRPQSGGETLAIDLGRGRRVCGLRLLLERGLVAEYPRVLSVEGRAEGGEWALVWKGPTAGLAIAGVLDHPAEAAIEIAFAADGIRHLRLRQEGRSARHWTVAGIEVIGE